MNKSELIKQIARIQKTTIVETERFYTAFEIAVKTAILDPNVEGDISLGESLGKFVLRQRKAYQLPENKFTFNPKNGKKMVVATGRKIKIPARTVVGFKVAKALTTAVQNQF
ncbi:HU family DNA-binding protein [Candidatus Phytoplasma prunorum]|uniref:HU family DNA-binding protein n=1 Tax=Candidatus Phytoplasma prunorum TaxID=47565 RepID=UPI002FF00777